MIKNVLNWIFFLFFLLGFLVYLPISISSLFFLALSFLFFPPLLKYFKKKQILAKMKVRVLLGIILSIFAFYFIPVEDTKMPVADTNMPVTDTNMPVADNNYETQQEPSQEEAPSISEPATEEATASDIVTDDSKKEDESKENSPIQTQETNSNKDLNLRVHFIDVGQGDSILIESNDHAMLIDAGENNQGKVVVNYLNSLGIKRLDYLIGTHPHSDHIGGLDDVIRNFDIDKVIMPDVVHTTKTFEDVIDAIAEKNLKITRAVSGNQYQLGSASFDIIAPNSSSYNNLNDYSVVIKLKNGDHSFLFTGDAEKTSENEMLQSGKDLSADVLKLGHHGSSTSNQGKFLDAVSPSYAVITLAKDNKYGHPHKEVISELSKRNISVLRTDEQGTIIIHSDGQKLDMNNKPVSISQQTTQPRQEKDTSNQVSTADMKETVYITNTGSKYHLDGCRHLKSKIEVSLQEALDKNLEPCKNCKPPK